MSEQYYVMELDEPAEASFCSFSKPFFGTLNEIETVIQVMEKDGSYEGTVAAWKDYQAGNRSTTHNVAYSERQFLRPVELITTARTVLKPRKWDHINVWGCTYPMKITGGTVYQIILKHEQKYYRCMKATLKNLQYESVSGEWTNVGSFWGNAPVMKVDHLKDGHSSVSNLLYVIEEEGSNLDVLVEHMLNPYEIKFDKFCDEIFADG